MAYPTTVDFRHTSLTVGAQPIAETSTTQMHPLGCRARAKDLAYGEGEFIYLKGVASTAKGDLCTYDTANADTARAVHAGSTSFGPCAVAMSANVASQYGWYLIAGAGPVASGTVAADAPLYLTTTAGTVDDAVVLGDLVDGIASRSADAAGFATCQLAYPSISALSAGSGLTSVLKTTLSAAVEAAEAIVVTGAVTDLAGNAVTSAVNVMVRTLAVTADKGDITVVSGTEKKTVNPTTGENVSWILTTAAGAFSVSVANDVAEVTLVTAQPANGLTSALTLTFT